MPAPLIATVDQGSQTGSVAATTASDTPIAVGTGYLARVLVTSTNGAAAINIYDNATAGSGKVIGVVPASAAAGTVYTFGMPYFLGITVKGAASNGAITLSYS